MRSREKLKNLHKDTRLKIEKSGCLGKDKHKSKLAAEYILNNFRGGNNANLNIYMCSFCNCWHIGNDKNINRKK